MHRYIIFSLHHSLITSHIKDGIISHLLIVFQRNKNLVYHAKEVVMLLTHFFLKVGDFPD
jgi:hypothetical protein